MTAEQVTYLSNIQAELFNLSDIITNKELIGTKSKQYRLNLILSTAAYEAITVYIENIDRDENFCDITTAYKFVDIINTSLETYYWVEL